MINVLIRVNASPATGLGNISRCLELAEIYLKFGNVKFWSNDEIVRKNATKLGLETVHLAKDFSPYIFDLLLIDTKESLTSFDLLSFRKFAKRIAFMENRSEAAIHSDMIIFPNAHYSRQSVFGNISTQLPKIIEGWKYVIIRKEVKDTPVRSDGGVVVTTGGSDPQNVAGKLAYLLAGSERKVTFLLGKYYNHTLKSIKNKNIVFEKFDLNTLSAADIVISTFGMSTYEGLYLRKPVISIAHSHENAVGSDLISKRSTVINLGYYEEVTQDKISKALADVTQNTRPEFDGNGSYEIVKATMDIL